MGEEQGRLHLVCFVDYLQKKIDVTPQKYWAVPLCRYQFYFSVCRSVSTEIIPCSNNVKTHFKGHASVFYMLLGIDSDGEEIGCEYETHDTGFYQGEVLATREGHKYTNKADVFLWPGTWAACYSQGWRGNFFIEPQNGGMVWVGRDHIDHLVPTPLPWAGIPSTRPVQPGSEQFQGGGSHSFSGQPGPGPHHPQSKEFLMSNLHLPSLSLKPLLLVLSLHALIKSTS